MKTPANSTTASTRLVAGPAKMTAICAQEPAAEVAPRRSIHARDLDVAAERDQPNAVLDAAAADTRERRREAQVELPRPHPDRERREEMPRLVDQDQERQAADRDE